MRYLGNKTRLLDFIRDVARRRGIVEGTVVDPFCGTASVARAFKRWGHPVHAADLMEFAHVLARAYVQTEAEVDFHDLREDLNGHAPDLAGAVAALNELPGERGFVYRNFSPSEHGEEAANGEDDRDPSSVRMYFTPANAARIDAVRARIRAWREAGRIGGDAYYVLLAALIEAADRVANTAGVYAAFIKSWQPNASRPLRLRPPRPVYGPGSRAERRDALELLRERGPFDVLYLDPPYNERQYPAYYHVPELIAMGWFDDVPELRGKTGLLPDADKRSDWCRRGRAAEALEELVSTARWKRLMLSYNSEGLIPPETIQAVLRRNGVARTYRRYRRGYRRYRSDSDGENRRYRGDAVFEYLYCVDR